MSLTPTTTFISRIVNGHLYRFWLDAYIDESGEIYYKASDLRQLEEQIKAMENEKRLTRIK
jgi:hypothetical protein